MADRDPLKGSRANQTQDSRQSAQPGAPQHSETAGKGANEQRKSGIGSSQGQDSATRDEPSRMRPSAGTPDVERGANTEEGERGGGSEESLVHDPTGAFKERP
jgi:hypothetical protein